MAARVYPNPYEPPSPEQWAKLEPLARRLVVPVKDDKGRDALPLIAAESPEFKSLRIKLHPQILGLGPETTPLAAVISWAPPAIIAEPYGGLDAAVAAGQKMIHGAALLFGLQTSADRYRDAAAAEALVMGEPGMRFVFSYDQWLIKLIDPARMNELMLAATARWKPAKDILVWLLLEHHKAWSAELSARVVQAVSEGGADSRGGWWRFGGNGFAENLHPDRIPQAIEALRPFVAAQSNAKRWTKKLKARAKANT